jgi:hypothetical protein
LWKNEVFTADDGGSWRVVAGNMLNCERNEHFLVAVAMGTEPAQLPAGTVLLSTASLAEDGWLQPNRAAWVLRAEDSHRGAVHASVGSVDGLFRLTGVVCIQAEPAIRFIGQ